MAYKVHIVKDYKNGGVTIRPRSRLRLSICLPGIAALLIAVCWLFAISEKPAAGLPPGGADAYPQTGLAYQPQADTAASIQNAAYRPEATAPESIYPAANDSPAVDAGGELPADQPGPDPVAAPLTESAEPDFVMPRPEAAAARPAPRPNRRQITVKSGDSLALIFSRLGLSPGLLHRIMSLGGEVNRLKRLRPGQLLNFSIAAGELLGLEYEFDLTHTLKLAKKEDGYRVELVSEPLQSVVRQVNATIEDSLFLAGRRAGLSDNLVMQLAAVYAWDIDFALDIRAGDAFSLIYEEQYKDGVKVSEGPVLAAEFINRNKPLRAARYTHADGRIAYYSDNGEAMRKAFLRAPVNFTRISSRFNLRRLHPILNKIRAHKGIDYAAPIGTPVRATADGRVVQAGRKGDYGKTVILKHGGRYSTVYAHLHRYAKGIRAGKSVKQGETIGYVGQTGLSTGPHLHYEFRINGVHRNPLTVELPRAESIDKKRLPEFRRSIAPVMAELDRLGGKTVLTAQKPDLPDTGPEPATEDG